MWEKRYMKLSCNLPWHVCEKGENRKKSWCKTQTSPAANPVSSIFNTYKTYLAYLWTLNITEQVTVLSFKSEKVRYGQWTFLLSYDLENICTLPFLCSENSNCFSTSQNTCYFDWMLNGYSIFISSLNFGNILALI